MAGRRRRPARPALSTGPQAELSRYRWPDVSEKNSRGCISGFFDRMISRRRHRRLPGHFWKCFLMRSARPVCCALPSDVFIEFYSSRRGRGGRWHPRAGAGGPCRSGRLPPRARVCTPSGGGVCASARGARVGLRFGLDGRGLSVAAWAGARGERRGVHGDESRGTGDRGAEQGSSSSNTHVCRECRRRHSLRGVRTLRS